MSQRWSIAPPRQLDERRAGFNDHIWAGERPQCQRHSSLK